MKKGFTLAETLITLSIIGIVAALTLPANVQKYKKHIVEIRLERFYSQINEAIRLSEVDNGDKKYWDPLKSRFDEDNNLNARIWYDKYLAKYLKTLRVENGRDDEGRVKVYFLDGSLLLVNSASWLYFPEAKAFEEYENSETHFTEFKRTMGGTKLFTFTFREKEKAVEPWHFYDDEETLKYNTMQGCYRNQNSDGERAYCAALIQRNGWKIPKDYPLKF